MSSCCGTCMRESSHEMRKHSRASGASGLAAREPATRGDRPSRRRTALQTASPIAIAFASMVVLALAGCASPGDIRPAAERIEPARVGAAGPDALPLAAAWWPAFGDRQLDAIVERALAGAPDLRLAEARIARARAAVAGARANEGPRLDGAIDATRQRFSENGIYPPPLAGSVQEIATAQLNGRWELDLFGRQRAALEAAVGTERAAEADAAAARVRLAVEVGRTWVQLARSIGQRAVLERTLAQREQVLGLIRQRVQAGLDTAAELRQGEVGVPDARAQLAAADEQIALARHALAALAAEPPETYAALAPRIVDVRAVPVPAVVPASLLERRADLAAARWRIEAASGDVSVARAQFLPSIDLTAFVGLNSLGFDQLLRGGSLQWGAGPAIRLPLLDAGRLRANLRGRVADLDAAVETYNAGVVTAVREVADGIVSSRTLERQASEQREALAAAEAAYDVAVQRYRAGLARYLTVLNAETSVLAQRRADVDVRARRVDVQLQLVRALGGGYAAADTRASGGHAPADTRASGGHAPADTHESGDPPTAAALPHAPAAAPRS